MSKPRFVAPLLIVFVLFVIATLIVKNPPSQPSDGKDRRLQMAVAALEVIPSDYQVVVESYGRVEPVTRSALVAQVAGQITHVGKQFNNGGEFKKGDVLLRIDDRDYQTNVKVAEAALLDAKRVLIEEQARAKLARDDWSRSGRAGKPDSLVLREPQMLAAKAGVLSAEASLDKAKLSLARTVVRAPYTGRVLTRSVDLGQVIGNNERLGEIYSSHALEVRLPLRNRDLAYVNLDDTVDDSVDGSAGSSEDSAAANVRLSSTLRDASAVWPAYLARTEAAIDDSSRQLHVVAELRPSESLQIPRIGQYVSAQILGKKIPNAIIVPLKSVYQGSFVYVIEDGHVYRREVGIAWQNQREALLRDGLAGGETIVLTSIGQVVSGTPVKIIEDISDDSAAKTGRLVTP